MLQATRGIVSGAPEFFNIAYGTNVEEFFDLLWYPEKFLFNRNYFSEGEGSSEFEEYRTLNLKLTAGEKEELYSVLSDKVRKNLFGISKAVKTKNVREILRFYEPITKAEENIIWIKAKEARTREDTFSLPADELVEDAGLAA